MFGAFGEQELDKPQGAMLAPRLKIKGEEYEDLDEIISRRVAACNDLVDDLLASNKVSSSSITITSWTYLQFLLACIT